MITLKDSLPSCNGCVTQNYLVYLVLFTSSKKNFIALEAKHLAEKPSLFNEIAANNKH
jgi:hypothetical protein